MKTWEIIKLLYAFPAVIISISLLIEFFKTYQHDQFWTNLFLVYYISTTIGYGMYYLRVQKQKINWRKNGK